MAQSVIAPRKRGLWQRMSEFDSRHPLLWNLVPLLLYLFILCAGATSWSESPRRLGLQLILGAALMVPLIWRRRYPFAVLLSQLVPMSFVLWFELTGAGGEIADSAAAIAFTLALYNVVLRRPLKLLWWAGLVGLATAVADWALNSRVRSLFELFIGQILPTAFVFAFIVAIAMLIRTRRSFQQSEREVAAQRAVQEERARIARDMHDIIGHNLAVINALADGGSYAATASPERAREALTAIGATSRQALSELRRVLSVLREDGSERPELAPQPGLSDLAALVERVREAGLPVSVKTTGYRWELSENQQLAVYRTVQEALTNALKHAAGPRRAQVAIEFGEDGLSVAVSNTGPVEVDTGVRRGLAGLSERAAAFGGTMEAGPQPSGGWRVAIWLPRAGTE
ncbi:sensor histidine kinase [Glycomyces xiaoerkulensis]|uniref:sensor histidine kinase n=1 Tax=Glycomyces xiaoerkulensis TaxID=2038139 RepID=UPI000C267AB1|nr:histidine kinase [Glycomyces xiaoerkulensis]